jgi:hypothetical protein
VKVFNDLVENDIEPKQMKTFFIVLDKIVELAEKNHFDDG